MAIRKIDKKDIDFTKIYGNSSDAMNQGDNTINVNEKYWGDNDELTFNEETGLISEGGVGLGFINPNDLKSGKNVETKEKGWAPGDSVWKGPNDPSVGGSLWKKTTEVSNENSGNDGVNTSSPANDLSEPTIVTFDGSNTKIIETRVSKDGNIISVKETSDDKPTYDQLKQELNDYHQRNDALFEENESTSESHSNIESINNYQDNKSFSEQSSVSNEQEQSVEESKQNVNEIESSPNQDNLDEINERYDNIVEEKGQNSVDYGCGRLTRYQLESLGLVKVDSGTNYGKDYARHIANDNVVTDGHRAIGYETNNANQIETFEKIINDNNGTLENLVISYNQGGSYGDVAGHVMLISKIEDGNVYFVDNFGVDAWETKAKEANVMSISDFENTYLQPKNTANYMTHIVNGDEVVNEEEIPNNETDNNNIENNINIADSNLSGYSGSIASKRNISAEAAQSLGVVTGGHQTYSVVDDSSYTGEVGTIKKSDYDLLIAQVAGEGGNAADDMFGVACTVINRLESGMGSSIRNVLEKGYFPWGETYRGYIPGGKFYNTQSGQDKLVVAKQAVDNALNGYRNMAPNVYYYSGDGVRNYFSDNV